MTVALPLNNKTETIVREIIERFEPESNWAFDDFLDYQKKFKDNLWSYISFNNPNWDFTAGRNFSYGLEPYVKLRLLGAPYAGCLIREPQADFDVYRKPLTLEGE